MGHLTERLNKNNFFNCWKLQKNGQSAAKSYVKQAYNNVAVGKVQRLDFYNRTPIRWKWEIT